MNKWKWLLASTILMAGCSSAAVDDFSNEMASEQLAAETVGNDREKVILDVDTTEQAPERIMQPILSDFNYWNIGIVNGANGWNIKNLVYAYLNAEHQFSDEPLEVALAEFEKIEADVVKMRTKHAEYMDYEYVRTLHDLVEDVCKEAERALEKRTEASLVKFNEALQAYATFYKELEQEYLY